MGHISVFSSEVIENFRLLRSPKLIFDGTLGGAGHTRLLLENFKTAHVVSGDIDENAINAAQDQLFSYTKSNLLTLKLGNFSKLITEFENNSLDGVLVDLGFSSNQLENKEYGMSFQIEAPLDMRLSRPPVGSTAWEWLTLSTEQEVSDIFFNYGEIYNANSFTKKLKTAIGEGMITDSTTSLARFCEKYLSSKDRKKIHPATKVFQALRIAVNDELRVLHVFLENVLVKLKPKGIFQVITFHSLEDRIVKNWAQKNAGGLESLSKKPLVPSEEEIRANPRARSAKLRAYQKI